MFGQHPGNLGICDSVKYCSNPHIKNRCRRCRTVRVGRVAYSAVGFSVVLFSMISCGQSSPPVAKGPVKQAVSERNSDISSISNNSDTDIWIFVDKKLIAVAGPHKKVNFSSSDLPLRASSEAVLLEVVGVQNERPALIAKGLVHGVSQAGEVAMHWPIVEASATEEQLQAKTEAPKSVLNAINESLSYNEMASVSKSLFRPLLLTTSADKNDVAIFIDAFGHSMVKVKAGTSLIGELDQTTKVPEKTVRITRDYWIAKTEVTQSQFRQVMGKNPSKVIGDDLPVSGVTWSDARQYCERLSVLTNLKYRLPTEAEWEVACRSGTQTLYFFGSDPAELERYAWTVANSNNGPHVVAQKYPNQIGLFDMYGNVREWCSDWAFDDSVRSLKIDPTGLTEPEAIKFAKDNFMHLGPEKVVKGGCFTSLSSFIYSAAVFSHPPSASESILGFRVLVEDVDALNIK